VLARHIATRNLMSGQLCNVAPTLGVQRTWRHPYHPVVCYPYLSVWGICPSTISFPDDNLSSAGWNLLRLCRYIWRRRVKVKVTWGTLLKHKMCSNSVTIGRMLTKFIFIMDTSNKDTSHINYPGFWFDLLFKVTEVKVQNITKLAYFVTVWLRMF
jgi:hypothetical protein